MKLSRNFTVAEFEKSATAIRHDIDNSMSHIELKNAKALAKNVLQPIRDHFGATSISSGFRSSLLNKIIGGSDKSQHSSGMAADFECINHDNYQVAKWIDENLYFDQLILEGYISGEPKSGWIHCSFNLFGNNRNETLTAHFINGSVQYTKGLIQ